MKESEAHYFIYQEVVVSIRAWDKMSCAMDADQITVLNQVNT